MATNYRAFKTELLGMRDEIREGVSNAIKDAIVAGYDYTLGSPGAGGSPKDTGWLRANIYVSLNVIIRDTIGSKKNVTTSRRERLIESFKNERPDRILNARNIYISYTVPYVSYVNDGTSRQAGQNFIERTEQVIQKRLNKVIR